MREVKTRIPFSEIVKAGNPSYTFRMKVDETKCTGCGQCAIECPSRIIEMVKKETDCQTAYCREACLASNDVRYAMKMVRDGKGFEEAFKYMTRVNPLPASIGRTCPHPCETDCSRGHLDEAVNLHEFERFIGDYAIENGLKFDVPEKNGKKAAVVGAGPSGLSAAYHLARTGFDVTVFEKEEEAGGILRYGVPAYRLPKEVVAAEAARIADMGVDIRTGVKLGTDITLDSLRAEYDAVFLGPGRTVSLGLGVDGQEMAIGALDYLHSPEGKVGKNVIVVGGGSVAMDAACSARRTGAENVTVVCLEKMGQMPANPHDLALAVEEGIVLKPGTAVEKLVKNADGTVTVTFKECISVFDENHRFAPSYGEILEETLTADTVISAIGQRADTGFAAGCDMTPGGIIIIDEAGRTSADGVYAAGDAATSKRAGSLAAAISTGMDAAAAIASDLGVKSPDEDKERIGIDEIDQAKYNSYITRNCGAEKTVEERLAGLGCEVTEGLCEECVLDEVKRCLVCGTAVAKYIGPQDAVKFNVACNNCHNCVDVCKEKAITFDYTVLSKSSDFVFSE